MSYLFYDLRNFNADISNWDDSGVTTMEGMFWVRSARALVPPALSRTLRARRLHCHHPTPSHPAPHAPLSTRQRVDSLSTANKLLIRCAWAGTSAFASAGYGSTWAPGSCTSS